jgi:nicotinate-nucleotide--dimethylbenzimidazole phosphoribosyltransferase
VNESFQVSNAAVDPNFEELLRTAIDSKTKPLGSLGRIEELAMSLGLIYQSITPRISNPRMLVFAGNHGITQSGVSAFPSEVTAQMVLNFMSGGAAINVLCRTFGIDLEIVNAGVEFDFPEHADLIDTPIAATTKNFHVEAAMTPAEVHAAIELGRSRVVAAVNGGSNFILLGEMGIGNTSSAACITARVTKASIDVCTGRGTGLTDESLTHKTTVLSEALELHKNAVAPLEVLATFGGLEIAAMVGAILQAGDLRIPVMVDGYITTAAALIAADLESSVRDVMVFSHRSQEPGHRIALQHLNAHELLNLDLRLGEGSGAALAFPLAKAATEILCDMATFEAAQVSGAIGSTDQ